MEGGLKDGLEGSMGVYDNRKPLNGGVWWRRRG